MILLRSNVSLKVNTTLEKGKKLGTLTHYLSSGTLTQKSIQWFRQQINDPISIQPKHCTGMEKRWDTRSKTVNHTILPEALHCRQTPHIPTDTTEQH